jgi:ketosteroid isomerase-like protein
MKVRIAVLLFAASALPLRAQTPNEQLELAERDFQRATLERGVDGWNSFFADSGAQLQNTSRIVRGHAAIKALMGDFLASKTARLIWWPIATEVSASGDMAYTFGGSGMVSADSAGRLGMTGRGTYLTVWRRQDGGRWLVTADMGGQASARALEQLRDSAAASEIAGLERARSQAIEGRNRTALEGIYSYDFLGVGANGRVVDREGLFPALLRSHKGEYFATELLAVAVSGETGLVTGVLRTNTDSMTSSRTSFLHIYVRRNGKWLLVRGMASPMK